MSGAGGNRIMKKECSVYGGFEVAINISLIFWGKVWSGCRTLNVYFTN